MKPLTYYVLAFVIFTSCEASIQISDSPEVVRAIYDTGYSGAYFSFKQDSTFEWFSGSALGSSNSYQGKYIIQDSVIVLDKGGFYDAVKSTRLMIKTNNAKPPNSEGDYLIQVNDHNQPLDSTLSFTIIVDKRYAKQ
jgi:hypothetical protein